MDNIGYILAGIFRPLSTGTKTAHGVSKSTTGVVDSWTIYGGNADTTKFNRVNSVDSSQIGIGTTSPTRQDFNIQTPFSNGGIEDNPVNSATFGYDGIDGKISIPTLISPTFGSGSITEVVHYVPMINATGTSLIYLVMRDTVAPVSFVNGESVNVNHEVLI